MVQHNIFSFMATVSCYESYNRQKPKVQVVDIIKIFWHATYIHTSVLTNINL